MWGGGGGGYSTGVTLSECPSGASRKACLGNNFQLQILIANIRGGHLDF